MLRDESLLSLFKVLSRNFREKIKENLKTLITMNRYVVKI